MPQQQGQPGGRHDSMKPRRHHDPKWALAQRIVGMSYLAEYDPEKGLGLTFAGQDPLNIGDDSNWGLWRSKGIASRSISSFSPCFPSVLTERQGDTTKALPLRKADTVDDRYAEKVVGQVTTLGGVNLPVGHPGITTAGMEEQSQEDIFFPAWINALCADSITRQNSTWLYDCTQKGEYDTKVRAPLHALFRVLSIAVGTQRTAEIGFDLDGMHVVDEQEKLVGRLGHRQGGPFRVSDLPSSVLDQKGRRVVPTGLAAGESSGAMWTADGAVGRLSGHLVFDPYTLFPFPAFRGEPIDTQWKNGYLRFDPDWPSFGGTKGAWRIQVPSDTFTMEPPLAPGTVTRQPTGSTGGTSGGGAAGSSGSPRQGRGGDAGDWNRDNNGKPFNPRPTNDPSDEQILEQIRERGRGGVRGAGGGVVSPAPTPTGGGIPVQPPGVTLDPSNTFNGQIPFTGQNNPLPPDQGGPPIWNDPLDGALEIDIKNIPDNVFGGGQAGAQDGGGGGIASSGVVTGGVGAGVGGGVLAGGYVPNGRPGMGSMIGFGNCIAVPNITLVAIPTDANAISVEGGRNTGTQVRDAMNASPLGPQLRCHSLGTGALGGAVTTTTQGGWETATAAAATIMSGGLSFFDAISGRYDPTRDAETAPATNTILVPGGLSELVFSHPVQDQDKLYNSGASIKQTSDGAGIQITPLDSDGNEVTSAQIILKNDGTATLGGASIATGSGGGNVGIGGSGEDGAISLTADTELGSVTNATSWTLGATYTGYPGGNKNIVVKATGAFTLNGTLAGNARSWIEP